MLHTLPEGRRPSLAAVIAVVNGFVAAVALMALARSGEQPNVRVEQLPCSWRDTLLHDLYQSHLRELKYIDLTHPIHPNMPLWGLFEQPSVGPANAAATDDGFIKHWQPFSYGGQGFVATAVSLPTDQMGTQLDPPAHWNEYGATISDLPPTVALRPLVVIDLTQKTAAHAGYHASVADVTDHERKHGKVPEGAAVFFRTDWSRKWDSYAPDRDGLPDVFPGVGLDALQFLHLNRSILLHGHEPLDTDMTPSLEGEAWLMHNNFLQVEGVTNLHLLPSTGALLSIGFAKVLGGTGGYAHLVAICPKDWPHGVSPIENPAAPLPKQHAPLRRGKDGVMRPVAGAAPTEYCSPGSAALGCPPPK